MELCRLISFFLGLILCLCSLNQHLRLFFPQSKIEHDQMSLVFEAILSFLSFYFLLICHTRSWPKSLNIRFSYLLSAFLGLSTALASILHTVLDVLQCDVRSIGSCEPEFFTINFFHTLLCCLQIFLVFSLMPLLAVPIIPSSFDWLLVFFGLTQFVKSCTACFVEETNAYQFLCYFSPFSSWLHFIQLVCVPLFWIKVVSAFFPSLASVYCDCDYHFFRKTLLRSLGLDHTRRDPPCSSIHHISPEGFDTSICCVPFLKHLLVIFIFFSLCWLITGELLLETQSLPSFLEAHNVTSVQHQSYALQCHLAYPLIGSSSFSPAPPPFVRSSSQPSSAPADSSFVTVELHKDRFFNPEVIGSIQVFILFFLIFVTLFVICGLFLRPFQTRQEEEQQLLQEHQQQPILEETIPLSSSDSLSSSSAAISSVPPAPSAPPPASPLTAAAHAAAAAWTRMQEEFFSGTPSISRRLASSDQSMFFTWDEPGVRLAVSFRFLLPVPAAFSFCLFSFLFWFCKMKQDLSIPCHLLLFLSSSLLFSHFASFMLSPCFSLVFSLVFSFVLIVSCLAFRIFSLSLSFSHFLSSHARRQTLFFLSLL